MASCIECLPCRYRESCDCDCHGGFAWPWGVLAVLLAIGWVLAGSWPV